MASWVWGYSDRLSAKPGEEVAFHLSATGGPCSVEIARLGRERQVVWRKEAVPVERHGVPEAPHIAGCGWPETFRVNVGADWPSGYYEVLFTGTDGATGYHMLCVKAPARRARAALVLATNTYHAYNSWGGSNTYVWIGGPEPAAIPADESLHSVAGRLSAERPFSRGLMKPASPKHRLVNEERRGFRERTVPGEVIHELDAGGNGWDCPAGFTDKWEHAFVAWAEEEGLALDYLTDKDMEEPGALNGYQAAFFVGHSEYWSWEQRAEAERFVDEGGRAVILSGNTCYWQCRWEDGGKTFTAYKSRAEDEDPAAHAPETRHLTSGYWSSPLVGKPEAQLTGLSFLFGGYHRMALCVARGVGGYTVWNDRHWALESTDLYWGDVFGDDCRLVGYENDGCQFTIGHDGLPKAIPRGGVPENLEIIATAPAMLGEPEDSEFSGLLPPEAWGPLTRAFAGFDSPENRTRLMRGHAVLATFKRGKGEVFNSGTTEWAYGLQAKNPFVEQITRNVIKRFLG